ncbi:MAG: hypothetical protein ABIJ92_04510 [Candidatus Aenigmatarchaeota archaeon]
MTDLDLSDYLVARTYLTEFPEDPTHEDIGTLIQLADSHDHFVIRERAYDILGRLGYPTELHVAAVDPHLVVRKTGNRWLNEWKVLYV